MSNFLNFILDRNSDLDGVPMKVIDMTNKSAAKEYLTKLPSETHTSAELEVLHKNIRYTQMFRQEESHEKMEEEELITRPIPSIPKLPKKR